MSDELRVLLVEDDEASREALASLLDGMGCLVGAAATLAEARVALVERPPDLVITDLELPDGSGLELFEGVGADAVDGAETVVLTGQASVDTAVSAFRQGASDYLTKPVDRQRLEQVVARAQRTLRLRTRISALQGELRGLGRFGALVGVSPQMQGVYDLIERAAPTRATVLISGETGVGKELVARALHDRSPRAAASFVAINCGAVASTLIESELFGHEQGAFTGAEQQRQGIFERADGGTLFLDEVTEMAPELQVRLLRVLETGAVTRVGGDEEIAVDVRVVAATNREPMEAVAEGKLREDLLYRLMVFPIELPPLRAREGDVELLAGHFLDGFNREHGTAKQFRSSALNKLRRHDWPGNVRELRNAVERAYVIAVDDEIAADDIPLTSAGRELPAAGGGPQLVVEVGQSISDVEKRLILRTLEHLDGDKPRAAELLGVSLKTLYNRLNSYAESD